MRRVAAGFLLATIGILAIVGMAAASMGASPPAQAQSEQKEISAKGWLGIVVADVNERTTTHFELSVESGAVVVQVNPDGPGAEAGLEPGDVIQTVNDEPIEDANALVEAIEGLGAGTQISISVARGADSLALDATLGERPNLKRGHGSLPQYLRELVGPALRGNVVHSEFELVNKDGETTIISVTSGKVQTSTDATLEVVRRDEQVATFDITDETRILVGGRRINVSGLREGTPVLVVERDGAVVWVLAWPRDYLRDQPAKNGHWNTPEALGRPFAQFGAERSLGPTLPAAPELRDQIERLLPQIGGEIPGLFGRDFPGLRVGNEVREMQKRMEREMREIQKAPQEEAQGQTGNVV